MAPLYLVITYLGTVGGTVGPLPYDMAECRVRAADMTASAERAWADPETAAKIRAADPKMRPGGMTFLCRHLTVRPENGTPWVGLPEVSP